MQVSRHMTSISPLIKRFKILDLSDHINCTTMHILAGIRACGTYLGESYKGAITPIRPLITPLVRQVLLKERRSDHIPSSDHHLIDELLAARRHTVPTQLDSS